MFYTSAHELADVLKFFKLSNCAGFDGISMRVVSALPDNVLSVLADAISLF